MVSLSNGKIRLETKVIDVATFQIRAKATEQNLERYYDEFIEHVPEISDHFADRTAFEKAVGEAAMDKRPKLIPRDPGYPFLYALATTPFDSQKGNRPPPVRDRWDARFARGDFLWSTRKLHPISCAQKHLWRFSGPKIFHQKC